MAGRSVKTISVNRVREEAAVREVPGYILQARTMNEPLIRRRSIGITEIAMIYKCDG
jgi:hypothetical protein